MDFRKADFKLLDEIFDVGIDDMSNISFVLESLDNEIKNIKIEKFHPRFLGKLNESPNPQEYKDGTMYKDTRSGTVYIVENGLWESLVEDGKPGSQGRQGVAGSGVGRTEVVDVINKELGISKNSLGNIIVNDPIIAEIRGAVMYQNKASAISLTSAFQNISYPTIDFQGRSLNLSSAGISAFNGSFIRVDYRFDYLNPGNSLDVVTIELRLGTVIMASIPLSLSSFTINSNDHILIEAYFEHMVDGSGGFAGPCHFGVKYSKVSDSGLLATGGEFSTPITLYGASYPTPLTNNLTPGARVKVFGTVGRTFFADVMRVFA